MTSAAGGAALLAFSPPAILQTLPGDTRAPSSAATPAQAPASGSLTYEPEAGYRYVYGFRRAITFQGQLGAGLPQADFRGEFYVDVLRADARSFEAVVSARVQGADAPRAPFLRVEASARGDDAEVFTSTGLDDTDRQHAAVAKDLVSLWLFPLRTDTAGAYDARFEPLPAEPGKARERKVKVAYLRQGPNVPTILSSKHFLTWDHALHLPAELTGQEATRLGKGATALEAEGRYELRFKTREKSPALARDTLRGLAERDALALDVTRPSMADHPEVRALDWGKLLADLRAADKLTGQQQLALFGDLVRYLRLHPEKTAELSKLLLDSALLKAGAASPVFRNAVGALATVATPEALAALRDAYDSPALAVDGKGMILSSLTTTQAPIDSTTREFLARKLDETDPRLAHGAAFALGSALGTAADDEQARSAVNELTARLGAAHGPAEQLPLLDAIGNSGRPEFAPALEMLSQAKDSAPEVRARAVFALRFVKTAAATQLLAGSLAAAEDGVRGAAASAIALAEWTEGFRAPLAACANGETLPAVREQCRQTLAEHQQVAGQ